MPTKINRLSPFEVANNAMLPTTKKRANLAEVETPEVFWNYDPVHAALPKLLLSAGRLFSWDLPSGDDEALIQNVERLCKSGPAQAENCTSVARAVIDWRNATGARGVLLEPAPIPYRNSAATLQFTESVSVVVNGQQYLIYFDYRSQMNLNRSGIAVVQSLIWHTNKIAERRNAKIAILRTPRVAKGKRKAVFDVLDGTPLLTLDELDRQISEVFSIWEIIQMARRTEESDGKKFKDGLFGDRQP